MSIKNILAGRTTLINNRSSPILIVAGEPNVKKTFVSIAMSPIEPILYASFSPKDLSSHKDWLSRYNLEVFVIPATKINTVSIKEFIKEVNRGTLILDDFSFLPFMRQCDVVDEILAKASKNLNFTLVSHICALPDKTGHRYLSLALPTKLLPLDKYIVDWAFISPGKIRMLGYREVKCFLS